MIGFLLFYHCLFFFFFFCFHIISGGTGKQGGSDVRELAKVLESKDRMIADYQRQIEELKRNKSKGNAIAIEIAVSFIVATTRIICVFFFFGFE